MGFVPQPNLRATSISEDTEYSGAIYLKKPSDYQYSPPLPGGEQTSPSEGFDVPDNSEIVGLYHTHAGYTEGLIDSIDGVDRNTNFSYKITPFGLSGDIPLSDETNLPNIMADPLGNVHEYFPDSYNPKAPLSERRKQRKGKSLGKCGCK